LPVSSTVKGVLRPVVALRADGHPLRCCFASACVREDRPCRLCWRLPVDIVQQQPRLAGAATTAAPGWIKCLITVFRAKDALTFCGVNGLTASSTSPSWWMQSAVTRARWHARPRLRRRQVQAELVPSSWRRRPAYKFCPGRLYICAASFSRRPYLLSGLHNHNHRRLPCPPWSFCCDLLTVAGALPSTKTPQSRAGASASPPASSRVALSKERIFWMKGPGGMSKSVASAQCVTSKRCRRFLSSSNRCSSSTRKVRARGHQEGRLELLLQAHDSAEGSEPRHPVATLFFGLAGCPVALDCHRVPTGPWW
jgi:hypothetical protein